MKKQLFITSLCLLSFMGLMAQTVNVSSPDGKLQVSIVCEKGHASYSVNYDGKSLVTPSALGLKADIGDFTKGLTLKDSKESRVDRTYTMTRTKASTSHFVANQVDLSFENKEGLPMTVTFLVANNDVAFRYTLMKGKGEFCGSAVIKKEMTSFNFPEQATSFICPQSKTMVGFAQTKPSYEEEYTPDAPLAKLSAFGEGYTFPCLFHIGNDGWVLVSETGANGHYVGSHLSDYQLGKGYTIAFPNAGEMKGQGSHHPAVALP
ncbi:MAG: glycoside hydrolase family 97 N-terminal domain-containing protein, partial [Prevotella sp.]|nr:glycoside hydrolase family 97 N-terminal domain-containing protein [Prevotella sp.]